MKLGELFRGVFKATVVEVVGYEGTNKPSRYVGRSDGAAPTVGDFAVGDWVIDGTTPAVYVCTVAGAPGTWATAGGGDSDHPGSGFNSVQIGVTAGSSGDYAVALGAGAVASGTSGVAIGPAATAGPQTVTVGAQAEGGDYNVAVGYNAGPTGAFDSGVMLGQDATITGHGGVAVGIDTSADTRSVALGKGALASADDAIAVGYLSEAIGTRSVALGKGAFVDTDDGIAVGWNAYASGIRSVAIGAAAEVLADDTIVLSCNDLEVDQSNGSGRTSIVLRDSSNVRWRIIVSTGGALVVAAA